jgi:FtsZ-binding cell division protein ZapB
MLARDQHAALAAADARQAAGAAALATAHSEIDRLGEVTASLSRELAGMDEQRHSLAEQNNELASQRDGLAVALAAAQSAATEASSQLEASLQQVAGLEHGLAGETQAHSAALAAAREQAAHQVQVLQSDIAQLRDHIAWRERQLQHAAVLLTATPDPLAGLPRLLAALVRKVAGVMRMASVADHQQAVTHWQAAALLPGLPEVPQGDELSLDGRLQVEHDLKKRGPGDIFGLDGPVTSMPVLLAPHDQHFIFTAYQAVLGRAPDPEGEGYYLSRLRAGEHKLAILKQLRQSPEGRAFIPGVAGLDRAIKRHVWATIPLLGMLVCLLRGDEGSSATHRSLRVLANDVGRIRIDHIGLRSEQAALTAAVRDLANEAGRLRNDYFGLWSDQAALITAVRELAPSAFTKQDTPTSQSAAQPHPETVSITEASATSEHSGEDSARQAQLADPLGSALCGAVERWQGRTA